MENNLTSYTWAFMGTPDIAVYFLEYLSVQYGAKPNLVITNPDQAEGRKKILTPSPVKQFAIKNEIDCLTAETTQDLETLLSKYDFVCVFAYGALLPQSIIDAPKYGTVNIHPSLLPEYRGPSPIITAILNDTKRTGVTLMKLVRAMDAGPIIAQSPIDISHWDTYTVHEREMAQIGARLLHDYMPDYVTGALFVEEQNHEQATYCPKYSKGDMEIDLNAEPYHQYRTYCAFSKPFFISNGTRYVVNLAHYETEHNRFIIKRVTPADKKERDFQPDDLPEN